MQIRALGNTKRRGRLLTRVSESKKVTELTGNCHSVYTEEVLSKDTFSWFKTTYLTGWLALITGVRETQVSEFVRNIGSVDRCPCSCANSLKARPFT
jgi:hypothetical protein